MENWAAIGAWRIHGDYVWLTQGAACSSLEQLLTAAETGCRDGGTGLARKNVVLLSLFDGVGTARFALDDMLRALRCSGAL
eukprot:6270139-Lingulodinium_polyedra.AAC.1